MVEVVVLSAQPKWNDVLEQPGKVFMWEGSAASIIQHGHNMDLPYPEWVSMAWKRQRVIQM
jgi:hypothetical protein